ncbi:MAG: hypothetical protein OXC94_04590 [Chloroflexi bacterium]|nr:hypothetical protein [Chloroflexota bacterium]
MGTLLGKHVITYGEKKEPYKLQRWDVPGGRLLTCDPGKVFEARVEPYSLDSIANAAAVITRIRARDENAFVGQLRDAGVTPATFHPHTIRRVVTQAIAGRELPDTATGTMASQAFLSAERVLMDIISVADRLPAGADPRDRWSMAMRLLQHQYVDHLGYGAYVRELWLNLRVVERAAELCVDLEDAYRRRFGLTYSEFAMLSFAAYATVIGDDSTGVLDSETWLSPRSAFSVRPEALSAFFEVASSDYAAVKVWARDPAVSEAGFEGYALSPLVHWPLIKRTDGRYVAPVARDLLVRPTRGFPIDVREAVQSESQREVVKRAMSEVYEDYVERLLRAASPQARVFRGAEILPEGRLNCDFVVVDGRLVTLVEVKAVHIRLKADMTKDFELLRSEFAGKGLGKGLAQISESARAIREGATDIPRNSILTGLLVVRGEQVFLNSTEMRILMEELASEHADRPVFVKYQVANDEGLSMLATAAAERGGLGTLLRDKVKNPVEFEEDFEEFASRRLDGDGSPPPLHDEFHGAVRTLLVTLGVPPDHSTRE